MIEIEELIRRMRKTSRGGYLDWVFLFVSIFFLVNVALELYSVHRICARAQVTWSHVLSLGYYGPQWGQSYHGAELRAVSGVADAFHGACTSAFTFFCFFFMRFRRNADRLLLELIDKNQSAEQAPERESSTSETSLCNAFGSLFSVIGGALILPAGLGWILSRDSLWLVLLISGVVLMIPGLIMVKVSTGRIAAKIAATHTALKPFCLEDMKRSLAILWIAGALILAALFGAEVAVQYWVKRTGQIMHSQNLDGIDYTIRLLLSIEQGNISNTTRSLVRDLDARLKVYELLTSKFGPPDVNHDPLLSIARRTSKQLKETEESPGAYSSKTVDGSQ